MSSKIPSSQAQSSPIAVNPSPNNSRFWWTVITLALPIALQMLLQSMLGMADVMMVSGLGSAAVAAVGLAAKLHFLLLVIMGGLATGCSVLVAQYSRSEERRVGKEWRCGYLA